MPASTPARTSWPSTPSPPICSPHSSNARSAYIDPLAAPEATSTFGAGSRRPLHARRPDCWHTHPHGQTVFVTEGIGRCEPEGGPVEVIRPGDRVFFAPGENHWHGAAPNRSMVHIAMQQNDESGSPVTWGQHVTDQEYSG